VVKRSVASAIAVSAIGVVGLVGGASAQSRPPSATASSACSAGYVHAVLPDGSKCLRSGEYCSHKAGYAAAYRHAGFVCDREGRLEAT
jgi:hypothetical protein